ncbi:MAG: hypothetical protein CMC35_06785 [Flavobacteriaceae bacterium]|nr:hypothetical protein [Flavobacteriaceae bacterium]|tara:strand:- start:46798 stop:47406 length:609 start_codon:yes stop_codon:yes gene_type:complete
MKQLFHTKKPRTHYLFPEEYTPPSGQLALFSTTGKKIMVDSESVAAYKISNAKAFGLLTSEIKERVDDLMKGAKTVSEQFTENTASEKGDTSASFKKKWKEGAAFVGLSNRVMRCFWKIHTTEDEQQLKKLKTEMHDIKLEFEALGYQPKDNFAAIPFELKERYRDNGTLDRFKESATAFERIIKDMNFKKSSKSEDSPEGK